MTAETVSASTYAAREARRIDRLRRAAFGVGQARPSFRALPRIQQESLVTEWVTEALESRAIRLGLLLPR